MPRRLATLFVAGLLVASVAAADVTFERKYVPEVSATTHVEAKTKQILTLAGMDLETESFRFLVMTSKAGKRAEDGTLPIVTTIDNLQLDLSAPGGIKLSFASSDPDKKADNPLLEPVLDLLRVSAKTKTTTLVDKDNRIKAIEFSDNPADKVGDDYKSTFDSEKRKKQAINELGVLPDKPVKPGDSWMHTSEADLGGGQTLTLETRYEYVGTEDKDGTTLDKVTLKTINVAYAMDPGSKSPLKIKSSELKVTSSDGTILFNRTFGAIVESVSKLKIEGDMKTEINATEFPAKLALTIESKTKLQP